MGASSAHGSSHPTVALSPLLSPKIQIVQDYEEEEASSRGAWRRLYRGNWRREQRLRGTEEQELSKAKEKTKKEEERISSFSFNFSISFAFDNSCSSVPLNLCSLLELPLYNHHHTPRDEASSSLESCTICIFGERRGDKATVG